jgi:GDP-L-fucose synthase
VVIKEKIFIAGQEGMVGSAVYRLLKEKNLNVIECKRIHLNLLNQASVDSWFKNNKIDIVINCAGRVGGILENSLKKDLFLNDNILIGMNLINSSIKYKIKQFINLGSACIYPKFTSQPIREDYLLTSELETTNEGYAIAKIATLKYCEYLHQYRKKNFISLQPTNLYGFNDNYDLKSSHVIPALVRKFHDALINNKKKVEIWGNKNTSRDFLFSEDLAQLIFFLLKKKIKYPYINVGSGREVSILELVKLIVEIIGYKGEYYFNKNMPAGQKRRVLSTKKLKSIGWMPHFSLELGLRKYYEWFKKEY